MDIPEAVYDEIKASLAEDLDERVLAVLRQHVGREHRIKRRALVEQAFCRQVDNANLANSRMDRQVRLCVEKLQQHYPILSTSGGGGYYYASSAEEINRYAAELCSRAAKLMNKSRRLEHLASRFAREVQACQP